MVSNGSIENQRLAFAVSLLCLLVFLTYLLTASGTIFGSDGGRRLLVTKRLVENGSADIQTMDSTPIGRDGKQYTQYAIGHSLAMVPFYGLGIQLARLLPAWKDEAIEFCVSLTNLVITVVLVGWLTIFSRALGFGLKTAVGIGLLYAFGTMAWQQAKDSFEHPQIALYLTALFFYLHKFSRHRKTISLLAAGLFLGLAILTRYTALLAYVGVAVFLTCQAFQFRPCAGARDVTWWFILVILPTLPFLAFDLWFNKVRFGSPLETGYQQLLSGNLFSPRTFLEGFWRLTFGWEIGLFPFNPVVLLGIIGAPFFYRKQRALTVSLLTLVVAQIVFYAFTTWPLWTGGWAWGPRLLLDVLPLVLLMEGSFLEHFWPKLRKPCFLRWTVLGLMALSLTIQAESVLVNYNRGFTKKSLQGTNLLQQAGSPKSSPLYRQAEDILEIWRNTRTGFRHNQKHIHTFTTTATMDQSLTFGTFQIWWVYALYLGVPGMWVLLYLIASFLLLGWGGWALWKHVFR
jgi:hypothetical protein